jgi:hypothetical protein
MAGKEKAAKRPSCTLAQVLETGALEVHVGGVLIGVVNPKEFSTGSFGFGFQGPVAIKLKDGIAECQVGLNITVKHSKPESAAA